MKLIKFKDNCTVLRDTGTYDEYDEPVLETVYEGACCYQEGSVSLTGIIIRKPTVYLPSNGVLVYINDIVHITTETGREINSEVELARDIRFVGSSTQITKMELKQGVGRDVRRAADDESGDNGEDGTDEGNGTESGADGTESGENGDAEEDSGNNEGNEELYGAQQEGV